MSIIGKRIAILQLLVLLLVIICVFPTDINAGKQMNKNSYILSFSIGVFRFLYNNGSITKLPNLYFNKNLYDIYWPAYNQKTDNLFFEAKDKLDNGKTYIYTYNIDDKNNKVAKIISGKHPSLSYDGKLLAYYIHPNEIWVLDLSLNDSKKVASDVINRQPVVWLSNNKIIYASLSKKARIVDVNSGKITDSGIEGVIPSAISPSGNQILCGSRNGKKIYSYSISTNSLKLIKKTKYLTMGTSFVWLPNDEGFLFTRQTWPSVLKLKESTDLFIYRFLKDEVHVMENITMFGGVSLQ